MPANDGGDRFVDVILCGIDVSKRLHQSHPEFPKTISKLADMAEAGMSVGGGNFKIYFHPRNYKAEAIIGKIDNFGKEKADIVYDLDQNVCWRRFVITKEICHVLYSPASTEHLTATPEEVEQLLDTIMAGVNIVSSNHAVSCDSSTMLMALEILLPHHQRAAVNAILASGKTVYDVALAYRLPQQWVRVYLSPGYMKLMDDGYGLAGC